MPNHYEHYSYTPKHRKEMLDHRTCDRLRASGDNLSLPPKRYLETNSAKSLLDALDAAGAVLTEEAKDELVHEKNARYGNAYAWITRELIKMINGPEGKFIEDIDVAKLENTGDDPTDIVIHMLKQLYERGDDRYSDIPIYPGRMHLYNGGCKDVEYYFVMAPYYDALRERQINGHPFLHKTYGIDTYLNQEPLKYKGVLIPKGFVWSKEDDGYYPLRATAFCFDKKTGHDIFARDFEYVEEIARSTHPAAIGAMFQRMGRCCATLESVSRV